MIGQANVALEGFDFFKEFCHAPLIARSSVQVNARNNVSASHATARHTAGMEKGWFDRLVEVIEADGRGRNKLSEDAGLGRNYVQQMINNKKEPGTGKLSQLLDTLGDSSALYVITGIHINQDDLQFLKAISLLPEGAKDLGRQFLERLAEKEQT